MPVKRLSPVWRTVAAFAIAASSTGCILTSDLPDPALDVPGGYKFSGSAQPDRATPSLDWWRGFRSRELTQLMEEAQAVNLDIAAASSRIRQADAQARITGAALLPSVSGGGQETYSRNSGSSSSGLSNGGREVVTYSSSLSASYELDFWGKNRDAALSAEETATASRFDRDTVALTTLAAVGNAYFQVLAAQDRIKTAERNIASAQRILDAIQSRLSAGTGTDLDLGRIAAGLLGQLLELDGGGQTSRASAHDDDVILHRLAGAKLLKDFLGRHRVSFCSGNRVWWVFFVRARFYVQSALDSHKKARPFEKCPAHGWGQAEPPCRLTSSDESEEGSC